MVSFAVLVPEIHLRSIHISSRRAIQTLCLSCLSERNAPSKLRQILHSLSAIVVALLFLAEARSTQIGHTVLQPQTRNQVATQDKLVKLDQTTPVERSIKGGEIHRYEVELTAGQFAHFVVEPRGIGVAVSLLEKDGRRVGEAKNANEKEERKDLLFIVSVTGTYRLEVAVPDKAAPAGNYVLRIAQLRAASAQEILRLKARELMTEAEVLEEKRIESVPMPLSRTQARPEQYFELSYRKIEKLEQAVAVWRQVPDTKEVARILHKIGEAYFILNDLNSARNSYEQSLQIWTAIPDVSEQLRVINSLGDLYTRLGEYERALASYNQGLKLAETLSGKDEANSLTNLGELFYHLGQFEKAADHNQRALSLWQRASDNYGEIRVHHNLDLIRSSQPRASFPISGNLELVLQNGHSGIVNAVAVSPNGRLIASGGSDHSVKLWELAENRELRTLAHHLNTVTSVRFSPDGRFVASASYDGTIKIIETDTGKQLRSLTGYRYAVSALDFNADGKHLVAGSVEGTLKLWEVATGREVRTLVSHKNPVTAVQFSFDGRMIASAGNDATVKIWDTASGRELRNLGGHRSILTSVAFTPDGKRIVSAGMNSELKLWDVATGSLVRDFVGHYFQINSVTISPDGRFLVSAGGSGTIKDTDGGLRVWELATGRQVQHLSSEGPVFHSVVFSKDGNWLVAGGNKASIRLWDASTWEAKSNTFASHVVEVSGVAISADGKLLASRNYDGIRLWRGSTGTEVRTLSTSSLGGPMAMSSDGRLVAAQNERGVSIWDTSTERVVRTFDVFLPQTSWRSPDTGEKISGLQSLAFSEDGNVLALASNCRRPMVLDIETGKEPSSWRNDTTVEAEGSNPRRDFDAYAVALTRDGRFVASAVQEVVEDPANRRLSVIANTVSIWDTKTGAVDSGNLPARVTALSFSPNDQWLAVGSEDNTVRIQDVNKGRELRLFRGLAGGANFLRFSRDGRWLAAAAGAEIKLWDTREWTERTIKGHTDTVTSVTMTDDSSRLISTSRDGSTRIWDVESGNELAKLIALDAGDWAVVMSDGHFDASPQGMKLMHWMLGSEAIAFEQLKERYYEPHLLAKVLGFDPERPREIKDTKIELFPRVDLTPPTASAELGVSLTNRGGGIGRVQVWVNDKEVTFNALPTNFDRSVGHTLLTVDLSKSSYFVGRDNNIRVVAFNAGEYLSSRPAIVSWRPHGNSNPPPPELYAIVAGISKYSSSTLNLKFAAKDADDMSQALKLGAQRLFGADRVHLTLLSTSGNPRAVAPTRANFEKAFQEAKRSRPSDIVIVYLAGHGITRENEDTYYYLTQEARSNASSVLSDPEVRKTTTVSSDDLAKWIREIPALKQVMVLDTCAAGAVESKLIRERNVSGDQIRAIERLKDRTGFHVLMGSAADAISYEATEYGQGLLTYALLQAMSGAALREGEYVDVQTLFQYAADQVPKLATGIGGIQKPRIAAARGASFDVGRLIKEDQSAIPLGTSKPIVLRPFFLNADAGEDALAVLINKELRRQLRDENYVLVERKISPRFVYIDVDEFKDGIRASGTYRVDGNRVVINLHLRKNDQILRSVTIEGSKNDVASIAEEIMNTIMTELRRN